MNPFVIELFDRQKHDRSGFSCGVIQVDNFFRKTANKLAEANNLRVFVMSAPEGGVIGFYALNAHAIAFSDLPPRFARARPSHGQIPAAFISMMGVDQRHSGQGYGGVLLADALRRIDRVADEMGMAVVMLDVLDCGDPVKTQRRLDLYTRYGFAPLTSQPLRLFLPLATIRKLST